MNVPRLLPRKATSPRRRRSLAAISVLPAVTLSGALVTTTQAASASSSPVTVTVWTWRSQDKPMWEKVQKQLDAKGYNIHIDFTADVATSYDSILETAMDGGRGPDIFYDRAGELTKTFGAAGLVAPLNNIVNFSQVAKSSIPPDTYNGKIYGVPLDVETMMIFYNKALVSQLHLKVPPATWSQWLSELSEVKKKGMVGLYVMGVQPWMQALQFDTLAASTFPGGFTQNLVSKKANYASAPYVAALGRFQQLTPYLEDDYSAVGQTDEEQEQAIALGRSVFNIDGIFDTVGMYAANPHVKLGEFLAPPLQAGQTPKVDWYPDAALSLNSHISNSAERTAAEEVMKFSSTTPFGQDFTDIAGETSTVAGVHVPSSDPLAVQAYKWYQTVPVSPIFGINSAMDIPPPDVATLKNSKIATPDGIFDAEQAVMLPLLQGKLTPKQAAGKIEKTVNWYFK